MAQEWHLRKKMKLNSHQFSFNMSLAMCGIQRDHMIQTTLLFFANQSSDVQLSCVQENDSSTEASMLQSFVDISSQSSIALWPTYNLYTPK